jgi:hypothetical protein
MEILEFLQQLNPQVRSKDVHVLYEDKFWMHAFNLAIGIDSLFEFMLNWFTERNSSAVITRSSQSSTKIAQKRFEMFSVYQLVQQVFDKVVSWQRKHTAFSSGNVSPSSNGLFGFHQSSYNPEFCVQTVFELLSNEYFHEISVHNFKKSFHFPLHRFLSYVIMETAKYPHLIETMVQFRNYLISTDGSGSNNSFYGIFTIARIALNALTLSKEIESGLWRKNGLVMLHQELNYSQPPFCRINFDLDLMSLQFSLLSMPIPLFLGLYLSSFGITFPLFPFLSDNVSAVVSSMLLMTPSNSDCLPSLVAEALELLINIVTELPSVPAESSSERLALRVRREWVNRLAGGVATYSQLQESLTSYPESNKINSEFLDQILSEISVKQIINPMSPPSYSLKRELWKEYDPCFPHINKSMHQIASDRKPKPIKDEPIIHPPFDVHPLFHQIRLDLLFHSDFFVILRQIFFSVGKLKLSPVLPQYKSNYFEELPTLNDTAYSRAVQLATIMILLLQEELNYSLDAQFQQKKEDFFTFLLSETMVLPSASCNDSSSSSSPVVTFPSLLKVWFDLYQCFKTSFDTRADQFHLGWIITQCKEMNENCRIMLEQYEKENSVLNTENNEKSKKMEDSRNRSLNALNNAAKNFLAMMEDLSDSDEDDENAEENGHKSRSGSASQQETRTTSLSTQAQKMLIDEEGNEVEGEEDEEGLGGAESKKQQEGEEEMDVFNDDSCIICRVDRSQDEHVSLFNHLGYLAFIQPSKVLWPKPENGLHTVEVISPGPDRNELSKMEVHTCNTCIGLCGHVMHIDCYQKYMLTTKQKSSQQSHMIFDALNGYFPCPLCKKMCNGVIRYPKPDKDYQQSRMSIGSTEKAEEEEENNPKAVQILKWIEDLLLLYNISEEGNIYEVNEDMTVSLFPWMNDIECKLGWEG